MTVLIVLILCGALSVRILTSNWRLMGFRMRSFPWPLAAIIFLTGPLGLLIAGTIWLMDRQARKDYRDGN